MEYVHVVNNVTDTNVAFCPCGVGWEGGEEGKRGVLLSLYIFLNLRFLLPRLTKIYSLSLEVPHLLRRK